MPQIVTSHDARRGVNVAMHRLSPRTLEVHRVDVIGPAMIRVTLTGERAGSIPFLPWAAGDHVKLLFPGDDGGVRLPRIENDRPIWGDVRGELRDYTIRAVDREAGTLTIDGVVHLHGPAGRWFAHASVGDSVGVLGPRGSHLYPPSYRHYVLVADETALPAVGRWLEEPGLCAHVSVITVAEELDAYPVPEADERAVVEPHHLVLPHGPERAAALTEHLRHTLETSPAPHDVFVWAAGEADMLKPVRRFLRDVGHPRHAMHLDGYWRRGEAGHDHHAVDDD